MECCIFCLQLPHTVSHLCIDAYFSFGALFLTGTFILYEWGSALGYGGCDAETSYCHPNINRAFEVGKRMLYIN